MPDPSIESVLPEPGSAPAEAPRPRRPPRPNYNYIHRFPLPVHIKPLPPLFPQNPLSYIHVACAYLIQLFSTQSSHPPTPYRGYLSPETRSIHVTDEQTVRILWEMGFFGKGNLSRSEPEWLDQEQKRQGFGKKDTSGEVTRKRREERREFKLQRAKKEQEALKERLKAELSVGHDQDMEKGLGALGGNGHLNGHVEKINATSTSINGLQEHGNDKVETSLENGSLDENDYGRDPAMSTGTSKASSEDGHIVSAGDDVSTKSSISSKTVRFSPTVERLEFEIPTPVETSGDMSLPSSSKVREAVIERQEHLQLTYEEALFLVYGLGVLEIYDEDRQCVLSTTALIRRFLRSTTDSVSPKPVFSEPDDPFLLSYVTYHHFRSLGWTVRSGIKFSVDYLLYNRGPAISHAEFAVIILPAYTHEYWRTTEMGRNQAKKSQSKSWWWLHCVNRVQSSVQKNLVLCYVDIPPPPRLPDSDGKTQGEELDVDIGETLKRYKVREVNIKRWTPNRSRD